MPTRAKVAELAWDILPNPRANNQASYRVFNEIKADKTLSFVLSVRWDRELGVSLCYRDVSPEAAARLESSRH